MIIIKRPFFFISEKFALNPLITRRVELVIIALRSETAGSITGKIQKNTRICTNPKNNSKRGCVMTHGEFLLVPHSAPLGHVPISHILPRWTRILNSIRDEITRTSAWGSHCGGWHIQKSADPRLIMLLSFRATLDTFRRECFIRRGGGGHGHYPCVVITHGWNIYILDYCIRWLLQQNMSNNRGPLSLLSQRLGREKMETWKKLSVTKFIM